jgi:hypothetical protein
MKAAYKQGDKVRVRNWSGTYTVSSRLKCGDEWLYYITDERGNGTYMNGPLLSLIDKPAPTEQGAQLAMF